MVAAKICCPIETIFDTLNAKGAIFAAKYFRDQKNRIADYDQLAP
jgi:methionine synthase I (cobalamin-dependent)